MIHMTHAHKNIKELSIKDDVEFLLLTLNFTFKILENIK